MKFSIVQAVSKAEGLPYLEKHVLTYLALFTDERLPTSQAVYPGIKTLMSRTGIQDKKTVIKHLATLKEKGYIVYAGRHSRIDSYTFSNDLLHFEELEAEYKQKKPTKYHQQTIGSLALAPSRSLSLVPSPDESDPLGDLQEYEQDSPLPAHQITRPEPSEVWSPETMVAIAACIASQEEYAHDEYERELQAAKIVFSLKPEHTSYKPIDRATFEMAYTFEHTRGVLATKKGRALSLRDFENIITLDMAIRLSREESAKKQQNKEKTPRFLEGAGYLGRDTVLPLGQATQLTPEQIEQRRIALQLKMQEIADKRKQTPAIRPGRSERARTNNQNGQ